MSDANLDRLDYYRLLGVPKDAPEAAIRRAFRAFARRYHPDRFAGKGEDKLARANLIYRRGAEGLQVLLDPAARKLYDIAITRGITRLTAEQRDNAGRVLQPRKVSQPRITSTEATQWFDTAMRIEKTDPKKAWQLLQKARKLEPKNALIQKHINRLTAQLRRGG